MRAMRQIVPMALSYLNLYQTHQVKIDSSDCKCTAARYPLDQKEPPSASLPLWLYVSSRADPAACPREIGVRPPSDAPAQIAVVILKAVVHDCGVEKRFESHMLQSMEFTVKARCLPSVLLTQDVHEYYHRSSYE